MRYWSVLFGAAAVLSVLAFLYAPFSPDWWLPVAGTPSHVISTFGREIDSLFIPKSITAATGKNVEITYTGRAVIKVKKEDGSLFTFTLYNVFYAPNSPCNLIFYGKLEADGVVFDGFTKKLVIRTSKAELA